MKIRSIQDEKEPFTPAEAVEYCLKMFSVKHLDDELDELDFYDHVTLHAAASEKLHTIFLEALRRRELTAYVLSSGAAVEIPAGMWQMSEPEMVLELDAGIFNNFLLSHSAFRELPEGLRSTDLFYFSGDVKSWMHRRLKKHPEIAQRKNDRATNDEIKAFLGRFYAGPPRRCTNAELRKEAIEELNKEIGAERFAKLRKDCDDTIKPGRPGRSKKSDQIDQ